MQNPTKIWSKKFTIARGDVITCEKVCEETDAQAWINIFKNDEPGAKFCINKYKPSLKNFVAN